MESNSLKSFKEKITTTFDNLSQTLAKENPKLGFSLQHLDHQLVWILQWKHPNNLEEYFEVELWQDQEKYSVMGSHRRDEITEISGIEYFCFEGMTLSELLTAVPKLIEEIRSGINLALHER